MNTIDTGAAAHGYTVALHRYRSALYLSGCAAFAGAVLLQKQLCGHIGLIGLQRLPMPDSHKSAE